MMTQTLDKYETSVDLPFLYRAAYQQTHYAQYLVSTRHLNVLETHDRRVLSLNPFSLTETLNRASLLNILETSICNIC